ncbi:uncharacterized protein Z520_05332 [Fonsecaea multimorphosa CBS 102226]|uniref:3CxxC-type domain-containing protein n=1 Tax=Fonsecaea multimorphosa CBS 102226 TaxID=1442371 RepID=A0A0D2IPL9_9EURO|nr:uncharacterized protein Z520_05332 [Fonsecaea multimorphosa CBS 102226]KIX98871.1 hypothetical protein Z520_05332 [Fonsecaea multimorphosa CBS 102226]OAL25149.1 hypothetical protein AYO22_05026 [Fonsecaea multimorphosa]
MVEKTYSKLSRAGEASNEGKNTSFMFPELHEDIENAISHNLTVKWVFRSKDDRNAHREYSTHVMGRFRCTNRSCDMSGWASKKVAILIRGYASNGYNAVVFNQRCKTCDTLGSLTLDEKSYIERVAYRIQKWAGVEVEQPHYVSKKGLPHRQELCEGCKRGICRQMSDWEHN